MIDAEIPVCLLRRLRPKWGPYFVFLPSDCMVVHRKGLSAGLPHKLGDIAGFVTVQFVGNLELLKDVLNGLSFLRVRAKCPL